MNPLPIIIWTDDLTAATIVRDQWRSEGRKCTIRAASFFGPGSLEATPILAFLKASNRDAIITAYRSEYYRDMHGDVQIIDIKTDDFGQAAEIPSVPTQDEEQVEDISADLLDQQLSSMDDVSLRTFVEGILGRKLHHKAGRAKLIQALRAHQAGGAAPHEEAEPDEDEASTASTASAGA